MNITTARVCDLMRDPVYLSADDSVISAARKMKESGSSCVVIVGGDGRVIGVFTERDLVRVIAEGKPLDSRISDVMTRDPIVVNVNDPVSKAILKMSERRIRNLPVVDDSGRLKGLLTARDITEALKRYYEDLGEIE